MPKKETNIDLQCTLCNKNPKFSDVSHLLTHIASKSHLAARFKLQIQAQSEIAAKEKLDQFDFWYRTNNLDPLLAERLAAKEQKKTKKSRASNVQCNVSIKKENEQSVPSQSMRLTPFAETPVHGFRAPVPRMHLWPEAAHTTPLSEWEPSPVYATPTARRQVPNFASEVTPVPLKLDPKLTTPWKPEPEDEETEKCNKSGEKLTDSAKLKGVLWPGMDLFDSATPEMKRMRNQKKDGAILEQMLATSMGTEPAEISYHANGEFRASRDIFGPLSTENSPEVPSPKKRKTRKTTGTLSNVSVNAPRMRAPRGKKAAVGRSPRKQHPSMLAPPAVFLKHAPTLNPLASGCGRRFVSTAEEDEEFRLTVEDMGKKKAFSVFQDATEASPARTETPLEEHRFDFPAHGLPLYSNDPANLTSFNVSPTPAAKVVSYRPSGKENGKLEQPAQQQSRRGPPTPSHIYPPQMFHDPPSINPLYNHAYARGFSVFAHHAYTMTNAPPGYGAFQGDLKPVKPMHRPQQPQGQGAGCDNTGFGKGMHYNM